MNSFRIFLIVIIMSGITGFFYFDGSNYLSLATLKNQQSLLLDYQLQHPLKIVILYSLLYIIVTGLSIPGATVLTLAGGALFGLFWGTVIVSFASTLGATAAFLGARFLFRDLVKKNYSEQLQTINEGMDKDGIFYLFTLRMVPLFPFFGINLLMGLTSIKTWTYFWVSQLGMLAGTLVYVNAGTQIAKLSSTADILSPALVGSFALLGFFPLIAKRIVEYFPRN